MERRQIDDNRSFHTALVAVIGSSGGGTATLGHTNARQLLANINEELNRIEAPEENQHQRRQRRRQTDLDKPSVPYRLGYALYISLHGGDGMDTANLSTSMATLYSVKCNEAGTDGSRREYSNSCARKDTPSRTDKNGEIEIVSLMTGPLGEVNRLCQELDTNVIASAIQRGQIAGLICISCDPKQVNAASLQAAAQKKIPVTGCGGTRYVSYLQVGLQSLVIEFLGNECHCSMSLIFTFQYFCCSINVWDYIRG